LIEPSVDRIAAPVKELLIATNPDPDSTLAYLMRVPLGDGIVLRTAGTWPRPQALYCYPVPADEWPDDPDIVERVPLRSCARRGAAIDIVAARARENRSQLVFTTARGRDAVFWQSPRTRKQARPPVALPTARAAGITELEIVVDAHERYAYRFAGQQVRTTSRGLPCGDYGIVLDGALVAAVERKSMPDLIASLTSGRLRYALGELAALPRAAVVVEDRYSQIFKQDRVRPALVADGIAECQIRWPNIPIVFCENRSLAEEWTYRDLAAAHTWASTEPAAIQRIGEQSTLRPVPERQTGPSPAEIRDWARRNAIDVPDRGRIPASIRHAWERSTRPPDP
jgi:ERCC4 domain/Lsr2